MGGEAATQQHIVSLPVDRRRVPKGLRLFPFRLAPLLVRRVSSRYL